MKKTTIKKAAKTSATPSKPATKTVKKAAAPSKKAVAAAPSKKAVAAAPAVKAGPAKAAGTVITASIDVGFGNALYIRGEGAGLSWDTGVLLECAKADCWSITLPETSKSIIYKFLINDLTWSAGPDYVAAPGKKTVVTPTF